MVQSRRRTDLMRGGAVQRRWAVAIAVAAVCALAVGCGSSNDDNSSSSSSSGNNSSAAKSGDTGATLTMWTRAATQTQSERFVKAYNASHKNQIKLTVIPTDNYQARVAAAAGGKNLPDLFASDVVYAPNYTSKGLYLDTTDRINKLPFAKSLAPAHMKLGTDNGKEYTGPHALDLSVWFWNKDL